MATTIRCCTENRDDDLIRSAIEWLSAFHPDISATLKQRDLILTSESRSDLSLQATWKTVVANERLLRRGADCRAAMLDALLR